MIKKSAAVRATDVPGTAWFDATAGRHLFPDMSHSITRQTFLVGPSVYLRPIELEDAALSAFWRPTPFPIPTDLSAEQLKETVPADTNAGTRRLVACRRSDGRPVGSAEINTTDKRTSSVNFHVPPVFGAEIGSRITAEMIRLLVPWLIHEHDRMVVWIQIPAGDLELTRAVRVVGMKLAFCLREAIKTEDGGRHDLECWQAIHPTWLARFGPPAETVLGNIDRTIRSPASRYYRGREADPPHNAMIVGNRVYLRAIEQPDAEEMAHWSMRETDTSFDSGRVFRSPITYWLWNRDNAQRNPPTWIRFAICLIEDGKVIGSNGLANIDWLNNTAETETDITRGNYRGGGYGTEAKHLLLEYGFNVLGLHMVRSLAWAYNTRSCEALRKQGYRDAGRLAWTGMKSGEMADHLVFDLLAREWRDARV
jgi:RimJ/RimL family protein N-acetyltransferase